MNTGISAINNAVQESSAFVRPLFNEIGKVIIGQSYLVERLVIGLLANGHVLLEGGPGLAKTLSVKSPRRMSKASAWMSFATASPSPTRPKPRTRRARS